SRGYAVAKPTKNLLAVRHPLFAAFATPDVSRDVVAVGREGFGDLQPRGVAHLAPGHAPDQAARRIGDQREAIGYPRPRAWSMNANAVGGRARARVGRDGEDRLAHRAAFRRRDGHEAFSLSTRRAIFSRRRIRISAGGSPWTGRSGVKVT